MFAKILEFFKKQEWGCNIVPGKTVAIVPLRGQNGTFQGVADVQAEYNRFIFLTILQQDVDKSRHPEMLKLINKLNNTRFIGSFEMNEETGNIRFKAGMVWNDVEAMNEIMESTIMMNIMSFDGALPAILDVANNGVSADAAFEKLQAMDTLASQGAAN